MRIVMTDDRHHYEGTPVQIVQQMRERSFAPTPDAVGFARWSAARMRDLGVEVSLGEGSEEEVCAEYVAQLVTAGLAQEV